MNDDSNSSEAIRRAGPSSDLVARTTRIESMQTIELSGKAPRISLSRTVFSHCFPRVAARRLELSSRRWFPTFVPLFWISQCIVIALPFIKTESSFVCQILSWMGVMLALPALVVTTGCLSIDMLRLTSLESEFQSGFVLNTTQWIFVAIAFEFDCRACVCVVQWWVVQLALVIDADFRLHEQRLRCTLTSALVNVAYLFVSTSGALSNSFKTVFTINQQETSLNDVLHWTAPTLAVVLLKSVYHQVRRRRKRHAQGIPIASTIATAYCSIVRARLTLVVTTDDGSRRKHEDADRRVNSLGVPLIRSSPTHVHIDFILRRDEREPGEAISTTEFVVLYSVGVLGFAATCVGTFVSQIAVATGSYSAAATWVPVSALVATGLFCGHIARFYCHPLLIELLCTFDVVFSSVQFLIGAFLLCELYEWDARCLNLLPWAMWFHWILAFDALTPTARAYLRLGKVTATPVALFLLYAVLGPFVLLYGYKDTTLRDYEPMIGHLRVSTLVLARGLTVCIWNAHLVWDIGVRSDGECIFLKDLVEYAVPIDPLTAASASTAVHPIESIPSQLFS